MKLLKSFLVLFGLALAMSSCKSSKGLVKDTDVVSERVALKNYKQNLPEFKTLSGKIKASYESGDDAQSLNITYRIEKDKTIWLSAKLMGLLTVAKVLITPEEVQFYEKINHTYFKGDFSIAQKYLGVTVNFEQLQNLLLGVNFYPIKKKSLYYNAPDFVSFEEAEPLLIFTAILDARQFRLKEQKLAKKDRSLHVIYKEFRRLNSYQFPKDIFILANENEASVRINLDFKSASLNESLSFPFSIPSNYKPVEL